MLTYIETLIRKCHGRVHEAAGLVFGYFDDPAQTHRCAYEIELLTHRKVELCGCQISLPIKAGRA